MTFVKNTDPIQRDDAAALQVRLNNLPSNTVEKLLVDAEAANATKMDFTGSTTGSAGTAEAASVQIQDAASALVKAYPDGGVTVKIKTTTTVSDAEIRAVAGSVDTNLVPQPVGTKLALASGASFAFGMSAGVGSFEVYSAQVGNVVLELVDSESTGLTVTATHTVAFS